MKVSKDELFAKIPAVDEAKVDTALNEEREAFDRKIIVLDDDPTGVQTVNGIHVYTDWSPESIAAGFAEENAMFFILTNSRAFQASETGAEHWKIAERVAAEAKRTGKGFMLISRSDSTLRGHYPLETETLAHALEEAGERIDGEVLMPFFKEGGRFTIGDVHYVQEGADLTPAGETEFARDKTFGYTASDMKEYIEEKTKGTFRAADVVSISLDDLRGVRVDAITAQLMAVTNFRKVIVNAVDYVDVKVFAVAMMRAMKAGKNFLFRTAAAWTKIIGGVADKPLLGRGELVVPGNKNGGLIIIGSHVKKTTEQFEKLRELKAVKFIEFNHMLVLDPPKLEEELRRVIAEAENAIRSGVTVAVYTGRKRFDAGSEEESLRVSVQISDAITSIVRRLSVQPAFLIAKGGITSSDVASRGLGIRRAIARGQMLPGIVSLWEPVDGPARGIPYIVFPGNVGDDRSLADVVDTLQASL